MRYTRYFALPALTLALCGANALFAGDHDWDGHRGDWGDRRYREMRRDYSRFGHLRADVERDQWRLNEAIRYGNEEAARHFAADLARDQRALDALSRDAWHDREGIYGSRRPWDDDDHEYRDDRGYGSYWRDR